MGCYSFLASLVEQHSPTADLSCPSICQSAIFIFKLFGWLSFDRSLCAFLKHKIRNWRKRLAPTSGENLPTCSSAPPVLGAETLEAESWQEPLGSIQGHLVLGYFLCGPFRAVNRQEAEFPGKFALLSN